MIYLPYQHGPSLGDSAEAIMIMMMIFFGGLVASEVIKFGRNLRDSMKALSAEEHKISLDARAVFVIVFRLSC